MFTRAAQRNQVLHENCCGSEVFATQLAIKYRFITAKLKIMCIFQVNQEHIANTIYRAMHLTQHVYEILVVMSALLEDNVLVVWAKTWTMLEYGKQDKSHLRT